MPKFFKAGELALTRNNFGAVSTSTLGKVAGSMTYNQFGEMASQSFSDGKKVLFSREYIRDNLGRVIRHQESAKDKKPQNYEYDSLGRLTKAYIGNDIREYRYDENGNRIAKKEDKKEVLSKYDVQDRLTNFGEFEYQYNANGELIKKIEHKYDFNHKKFNTKNDRFEIITYEYDSFGNLKKVILPKNKVIEYILDGQHRRIGKKLNGVLKEAYVYQSQTQIAAVLSPTGAVLKQFIYGEKLNIPDYVIEKGKTYRIISNPIGSPELLVEVTKGRIEEEFAFDEFGIPDRHNDDKSILPFGFAGGLYDQDTKLFHFGARDYDPEVGRWTSKDPILFDGGDTNLYGYVLQDPVNFIDPTGEIGERYSSLGSCLVAEMAKALVNREAARQGIAEANKNLSRISDNNDSNGANQCPRNGGKSIPDPSKTPYLDLINELGPAASGTLGSMSNDVLQLCMQEFQK